MQVPAIAVAYDEEHILQYDELLQVEHKFGQGEQVELLLWKNAVLQVQLPAFIELFETHRMQVPKLSHRTHKEEQF